MKKLLLIALLLAGSAFAGDIRVLVQNAKPAVVHIATLDKNGKLLATGTGFFISADGYLVTNEHVVEGAHSILARDYKGTVFHVFRSKDSYSEFLSVNGPPNPDVEMLRADATNVPYLRLCSTANEVEGQRVLVIGNPLDEEFTVSDGIISSFRDNRSVIQITAAISHGSSGSPVLDCDTGEVIGVATWISKEGQNLNYAISSEKIQSVIARTGFISPVAVVTPTPTPPPVAVTTPKSKAVPWPTYWNDFRDVSPSDPNAENLADDCFLQACRERKLGDYVGAIRDYTEAIRFWPRSVPSYEGRATAYDAIGNHLQAEQDRKKAKELRKNK